MDLNPKDDSLNGWQLLGDLKISYDSNIETVIRTWLLKTLEPVSLPTDFIDRIHKSVFKTVADLLKSDEQRHDHIHLIIFIRKQKTEGSHAWGFFRIEKLEDTTQEKFNHAVEFYLYPDG